MFKGQPKGLIFAALANMGERLVLHNDGDPDPVYLGKIWPDETTTESSIPSFMP